MNDVVWARIRSWHLLRHALGVTTNQTACGRTVTAAAYAARSDELPTGKSCETCLRALAREVDADA